MKISVHFAKLFICSEDTKTFQNFRGLTNETCAFLESFVIMTFAEVPTLAHNFFLFQINRPARRCLDYLGDSQFQHIKMLFISCENKNVTPTSTYGVECLYPLNTLTFHRACKIVDPKKQKI